MSIEAMKQALEALEDMHIVELAIEDLQSWNKAVKSLRQAIAEAEKQEPVAWADYGVLNWIADMQFKHASYLYTHPQPKREPLTIEQLLEHWRVAKVLDMTDAEIDFADYVLIARDVEALYGITSDMKQEHVDETAKQRHEENT